MPNNKKIKQKNIILAIVLLSTFYFLLSTSLASAQVVEIPNPLGSTSDIPTLIDKIATWLLGIGSTIAVIVILWAAFLFMTAGGNKERVTKARQTLWYAIIGLTVLLLAKGVTSIVENFLSGKI